VLCAPNRRIDGALERSRVESNERVLMEFCPPSIPGFREYCSLGAVLAVAIPGGGNVLLAKCPRIAGAWNLVSACSSYHWFDVLHRNGLSSPVGPEAGQPGCGAKFQTD